MFKVAAVNEKRDPLGQAFTPESPFRRFLINFQRCAESFVISSFGVSAVSAALESLRHFELQIFGLNKPEKCADYFEVALATF